jgi:hypothetical protein
LLVNIAHISKVNALRVLLRPIRAVWACWTADMHLPIREVSRPALRLEPTPMPKIEVKRIQASMTISDMEAHWVAVVDYGAFEVEIPLPARYLIDDNVDTHHATVEQLEIK